MFSSTRTCLLIFLAMLQFIAPLVHAHAGKQIPTFGLHVPGLEAYSAIDDALISEAAICYSCSEDFIFGVNDGIKQKRNHSGADNPHSFYLPQQAIVIRAVIPTYDTDFLDCSSPFISRFQPPSHPPRAPPAH
jgi:hypothetical protein